MKLKTVIAHAVQHLMDGKPALGIGRSSEPESMYNNPQLYPQAFPWLFPYGLGGIGNVNGFKKISDPARKRALLMYYDKRFQMEPLFPLVAFNHQQIQHSTTGGFLLTQKNRFPLMAERILKASSNLDVMTSLVERMEAGETITPITPAEKECFAIINDLDHVAKHVEGSNTNKKYMRNEIWSLICAKGAPSWFITFAPMDLKHPLCLYLASEDLRFYPKMYAEDKRWSLIANNPVACARFFHFMVQAFIKHILGVGTSHHGLYGDTNGYYGTVEE
ncbi:hypothetical protein DENSPDRAFT_788862, partial [Dentipellis sp. KUC8613]